MDNFILQFDTNPYKLMESSSNLSHLHRKQARVQRFQDLVLLPNIIDDRDYLSRKQTFDTFLKKTDSEFLNIYLKSEKNSNNNHKALSNIRSSDYNSKVNLPAKKQQGKMLSNELWSENYYRTIINSSYIRGKFEKIVNEVKSRKYETKIKITDDYYKRKHKSFYNRQSILKGLFNNFDQQILPLKVITEQPVKKIAARSLSEWMSNKKKGINEEVVNMKDNLYGIIRNCNTACSLNNTLKKLIINSCKFC